MDSVEDIIAMYYPNGGCPEIIREMVTVAYEEGRKMGLMDGRSKE